MLSLGRLNYCYTFGGNQVPRVNSTGYPPFRRCIICKSDVHAGFALPAGQDSTTIKATETERERERESELSLSLSLSVFFLGVRGDLDAFGSDDLQ